MMLSKTLKTALRRFVANWFVCRITSGRKSALYGLRFSYPIYISLVTIGVILVNPYILSFTAIIALLGVMLPMHPFDYVHNYVIAGLINIKKITGRGSELQINSTVALIFNMVVIASIFYKLQLNYGLMAILYVLSSIFFIVVLLFKENFSIYSISNIFSSKNQ